MTSCPACDKPVDPLRSRFVGVRDGKVVAFCSAACAAGEGLADAERAVPPAPGVPARSETVAPSAPPPAGEPVRTQPPAAGVPAGPRSTTPAPGVPIHPGEGSGERPGERGEVAPGASGSGPVIEIVHEPASGGATRARDALAEPRARPPDEDEREDEDEDNAGAVTAPAGAAVSAPVARPVGKLQREAAAPSPTAGEAGREASARAPSDAVLEPPPRRSRLPILLLVLVLVGGGGFLLYRYIVDGGLAAATRPSAPPASSAPAEPPRPIRAPAPSAASAPREAAPPVDVAAAVERARDTLRGELAATTPRVQRLAAAALARTQDPAACALLAAQIGVGADRAPAPRTGADGAQADDPRTSDIARLGLAYALARGGDRRGSDVLAAALGAPRGEARDESARLLALLGDRRAVPHLLDLLAVAQRRLGAAEHLAHLGEPHAVKVLDQVRADPRASVDDKARATVALGIAGRGDVAAALRDMLGEPHFNAFAATALAELKDRAARPVLEHQLGSPPLRVLAARALRRLDPTIDAGPLLAPLLEVMRAGRDIERIPAAEAVLLLAGPERWSAYR